MTHRCKKILQYTVVLCTPKASVWAEVHRKIWLDFIVMCLGTYVTYCSTIVYIFLNYCICVKAKKVVIMRLKYLVFFSSYT